MSTTQQSDQDKEMGRHERDALNAVRGLQA
jgi:hypothetical protein